jgi:hypothetical protein
MDLQTQIQSLIDNAPQDGITPKLIVAITPAILGIAKKLRHPQYYILQHLKEGWVLTTLRNRKNAKLVRRVIYAYPTLQDIPTADHSGLDPQVTATPIPVTHILFQLLATEPVDSIVFLDSPGINDSGVEVKRRDLQNLIQKLLPQQNKNYSGSEIPPDIA